MEESSFNVVVSNAIHRGLSPVQAVNYAAFMNRFKPDDLLALTDYAGEWMRRFKGNPTNSMDDDSLALYFRTKTNVDDFVERL